MVPIPMPLNDLPQDNAQQSLQDCQNDMATAAAFSSEESEGEEPQLPEVELENPDPYAGYVQLDLAADVDGPSSSGSEDENDAEPIPNQTPVEEIPRASLLPGNVNRDFEQALESSDSVHLNDTDFTVHHRGRQEGLPSDEKTFEQVKACMAGFEIPPANQPAWAKIVPEDNWKSHLVHKLKK